MQRKKRNILLALSVIAVLNFVPGAFLYSIIGETNENGDFEVIKSHQFILIFLALISILSTIVLLFVKKK